MLGTLDRPKSIIIVEDHTILRDGLRAILSDFPEFKVIGEAGDGLEAIRITERLKPDLVLLDLKMPRMNGLEAIKHIRKSSPQTKILILTIYRSVDHCLSTLQAGAHGYALKDSKQDELLQAVRETLAGKKYICGELAEQVAAALGDRRKQVDVVNTPLAQLTAREKEILKMVAEGHSNKKIAEMLYISPKTVDNHRTNLMRKLDLHSIQALTQLAMKEGLLLEE